MESQTLFSLPPKDPIDVLLWKIERKMLRENDFVSPAHYYAFKHLPLKKMKKYRTESYVVLYREIGVEAIYIMGYDGGKVFLHKLPREELPQCDSDVRASLRYNVDAVLEGVRSLEEYKSYRVQGDLVFEILPPHFYFLELEGALEGELSRIYRAIIVQRIHHYLNQLRLANEIIWLRWGELAISIPGVTRDYEFRKKAFETIVDKIKESGILEDLKEDVDVDYDFMSDFHWGRRYGELILRVNPHLKEGRGKKLVEEIMRNVKLAERTEMFGNHKIIYTGYPRRISIVIRPCAVCEEFTTTITTRLLYVLEGVRLEHPEHGVVEYDVSDKAVEVRTIAVGDDFDDRLNYFQLKHLIKALR